MSAPMREKIDAAISRLQLARVGTSAMALSELEGANTHIQAAYRIATDLAREAAGRHGTPTPREAVLS